MPRVFSPRGFLLILVSNCQQAKFYCEVKIMAGRRLE
jgi:hypothetical protein